MKKITLLFGAIICLFFHQIAKSATQPIAASDEVIYVPIEDKKNKNNGSNNRSLIVPIDCWYNLQREELYVESSAEDRLETICLRNPQSFETIAYDLNGVSQCSVSIPMNWRTYTITIYTETGKEYWGWFVVE